MPGMFQPEPIPDQFPDTMSTEGAAKRLKCNRQTVIRWCGKLGIRRIGSGFRITENDLVALRGVVRKHKGRPKGSGKK